MLFKTDFIVFNGIIRKMIFIGLIVLPIISVAINVFYTPFFITHGDLEKDTLTVLDKVNGKFIILTDESYPTSYTRAYYSYAAIYLDKYTSSGFYQQYISQDYFSRLKEINNYFKDNDPRILETLNLLNTTDIISYDNGCNKLEKLNLEKRFKKGRVCLYINEQANS